MRIRSIRPEFWSSHDIAGLTWDQRLIFIGLWSYVDDNGVGRDVPRLIVADLFPLDEDMRGALKKIEGALTEYSSRGLITRYEVDGKPYLHITTFHKHQVINRPSKGRYPLPTCKDAEAQAPLTEPSVSTQVNAPLGEGEKGRRGEVTTSVGKPPATDRFAEFWDRYPKKTAKRAAEKAWTAATKRATPDVILAGLARHRFNSDAQYVPHPATWLNQDRWADQTGTAPATANGQRKWTNAELDAVLGADLWVQPQPPGHLDPDAKYTWWVAAINDHRAERIRQAEERSA